MVLSSYSLTWQACHVSYPWDISDVTSRSKAENDGIGEQGDWTYEIESKKHKMHLDGQLGLLEPPIRPYINPS